MRRLIFFDYDKSIVDAFIKIISVIQFENTKLKKANINPIFEYIQCDVRKLEKKVDIFVSPANSHGYMDGGIDEIYMKMFKGISETVRLKNKQIDIKNSRGQYILPIGSATIINIPEAYERAKQLICAPTMELPSNIEKIQKVYYAMLAILQVSKDLSYDTVIAIPGLGTGVGGMSGEECATQIYNAIYDFINEKIVYPFGINIRYSECDYFIVDRQFL